MDEWLRLRIRDVPLQWHEAVAIVRDVADALAEGEIREVPAGDSLAVDSGGTVHLLQSGSARKPLPAIDDARLVAELGRLLGELLPPQGVPQELTRLAASPAPATPAEFSQALAFFERPSRERDLQALATRLRETQEQHRLEEELETLTRKARTDAQALPVPAVQATRVPERLIRLRKYLLMGGGGAAVLLAIVGLLALGPAPDQSSTRDRSGAARREEGFFARVRDSARSMLGTSHAPPAAPAIEGPKASPEPRKPPRRSPPVMRRVLPEPRPVPAGLPGSITASQWEEIAVPVSRVNSPAGFAVRAIFDRGDRDVVPAVLVRPHLPTVPQPVGAGKPISALDVIVAEDGRVEQVRLIATSPERRYYDAMILAAVKAWIFQPARRNGQPVRYRVRIPLT